MADTVNLPLTGSGDSTAIVATDDAGAGGQVQIIKLAISADGSATVIPADAANGLDVDVTRLPALVAGAATIGSIASIGTSVVPGTGATNLGKAEDAAHTSGDTGVMALGVRNDTATALATTTLDYIPLTTDANGGLWATLATLLAGENLTTNRLNVEPIYSYTNITTATTTTVKSGAGTLHVIAINTPVASATITVYDNTAGSGTKIGTITLGGTLANDVYDPVLLDVSFGTGLTIVTSGATDLTIGYR